MANTLTEVMPKILAQGLLALRQECVLPRLVNTNWSREVASKGSTIDVPIPSAITAVAVTPDKDPPVTADVAPTKVAITLDKWFEAPFQLSDKEIGEAMEGVIPMQVSEAVKALANQVSNDLWGTYTGIFGFVGTAGTVPFNAGTVADATAARKILNKQLAPMDPRRAVLNPDGEASALALAAFNANAGTQEKGPMIDGSIGRKLGFDWFMDQLVLTHTRNALGAGALTVNGVNALGATTLSIAKGAGANWTAKKGDLITIAGDTQQYVITNDPTVVVVQGANTNVTISPALAKATVGGEAITSIDTHVVNLGFHRDAFALAIRPLEAPGDGLGNLIMSASDPKTGMGLRLEISREHKRTRWSFDILYGVKLVRPELAVRILG